jgi:hypothetical protein
MCTSFFLNIPKWWSNQYDKIWLTFSSQSCRAGEICLLAWNTVDSTCRGQHLIAGNLVGRNYKYIWNFLSSFLPIRSFFYFQDNLKIGQQVRKCNIIQVNKEMAQYFFLLNKWKRTYTHAYVHTWQITQCLSLCVSLFKRIKTSWNQ